MSCYRELGQVQKPYQYVGHEENTYAKDFAQSSVRCALAFPDAYEIGMSNVGMQILYHVINEHPGFLADRVYAPLVDMGQMLKRTGQKLKARESERELAEFDCIGFTLQYELCYTNILYMLDLAGIPRHSQARAEADPLIMAGGPCAFNSEPIADFIDFVVIGEGEEVIIEVLSLLADLKDQGASRAAKLLALSKIKGVYVPSFYRAAYDAAGRFHKLERIHPEAPRWVERRIIKDLDKVPYPTRPLTPAVQPVHERISVEVQRGCTRACRFCQAGYIYRPRRERNPNNILSIIDASVQATGIKDIGLLSLSSADYSHLHPLMRSIMDKYRGEHLSISLPSTRLEALKEEYLDVLKEERRSGFTIAPEAGSQRLRNVINKNFTEAEVVDTARMLFKHGWQSIKMYFMIGQPTETDEDVIAIAELANTVMRATSELPGRKSVTVSVSNFVPKPFTPFQWHEQISAAEIKRKQRLIRDHIGFKNNIQFRCHAADSSVAEGLLARGDRRVAWLIERVYELGAVFDCWQDRFDINLWLTAVEQLKAETGIDFFEQGHRQRDLDERLPWHRVHSGLHPKFLKNEWTKALYGVATEDCSFAACHECGLCNEHTGVEPIVHKEPVPIAALPKNEAHADDLPSGPANTYRFQYKKVGHGTFLGVTDLVNVLLRAFRRTGLRLVYDNAIHQRPRLTMGAALPMGVSSTSELFDLVLETEAEPSLIVSRVNRYLPRDLQILTATRLEPKAPGLPKLIRALSYKVAVSDLQVRAHTTASQVAARILQINKETNYMVTRARRSATGEVRSSTLDIKESVEALYLDGENVWFTLKAPNGQGISPHVIVEALVAQETFDTERQVPIHKTGFHTYQAQTPGGLDA